MAEYYPLIARAVVTMRDAPVEQRKAIYDRARAALLGQLRSMQPPVPEESIARESNALDEAIARVESEIGSPPADPPLPAQAPAIVTAPAAPPAPASTPSVQPDQSSPVRKPEPPVEAAPRSEMVMAAPGRGAARPAADALSRIVAERPPVVPVLRATRDDDDEGARGAPPLPSAARLQVPTFSEVLADAARRTPGQEAPEAAEAAPPREEVLRPAAPRPTTREAFNPRALILAAVALAVMAGIGYAAWRLRDRPEALARSRAAMAAQQAAEAEQPAKVITRADGSAADATSQPNPAASPAAPVARSGAAPADDAARPVSGTTAPASPSDAVAPSSAAAPASATAPAATTAVPAIPVAQRAAFLVDAPDDPQKIKTFVGSVVWSTENTAPSQNAPIARAVRAEIDVPDAGMKMSLVFQKNAEPQFPASHTLELRFTPTAGSAVGGVKQISVPQMRRDDSQTGDPLIGLPVTITDNYFLVGLSRGEATGRNLELIQSRNWFDVPLLLNSGKIAKVTFEKGAAGQAAIADVVASWQ